ncbi:NIPSNAP protein [Duganella sp. CF458]|uniref:NIPSNAP family protein n=1 Tax=Duganella sp. CF458 TaxID=1884368 RepID=UPI0008E9EBF6|nr:NIPSNAP family protein [Duganella sp. CF458]SFF99121.1 NIPSNAP protein [Duganella sp. CF458]
MDTYPVIEFRRYTTVEGGQAAFSRYFETLFPEAFQQLGALALGQFTERGNPNSFLWMRGFTSWEQRAVANAAFYYGPVWREHKATLNGLMTDSDNVLLLRPLRPGSGVPVMPAVDPVMEPDGAQGEAVAILCTVKPGQLDRFVELAEPAFAAWNKAGWRDAGILVTLDMPNNFPQLPVRGDGPHLVWLGIAPPGSPPAPLEALTDAARDLLHEPPERILLRPTHRSRLRYNTKI